MISKILALLLSLLSLSQTTLDAYIAETNLGGNLFLVNRTYMLDREYVPEDLVKPNVLKTSEDITMRQEAARALEEMFQCALAEGGFTLQAVSGYRAYNTQAAIFERKINNTGSKKKAQLLVAPAGSSEHQLGLAMDVGRKTNTDLNKSFGSTPEGIWVAENAHRFGYIIRYKKEWTEITGYAYEPWHIRYVGKEHAERIYTLDIPLEHYIEQLQKAAFGERIMAAGGVQQ